MGKRTSRFALLLLFTQLLLGCDGASSTSALSESGSSPEHHLEPADASSTPSPDADAAEAALRAFVVQARSGSLEAIRGAWHPESRHRVDIERLVEERAETLTRLLDGIEAALDSGVALEAKPLRPTDRGGARRALRYACLNRAGEARTCELQMLTDHAGRWYVDDLD